MIKSWKVFNFKSIRKETELQFGPLTFFAGANSSGKSTIIQSILLLAQTLANKVGSRSVVLNGSLTSLGQFDDLKSADSEADQISIRCECSTSHENEFPTMHRAAFLQRGQYAYGPRSIPLQSVSCEISFDSAPGSAQREIAQIQPRLFATQMSCIYRDTDNLDLKADLSIRASEKALVNATDIEEIDDRLRTGLSYDVEIDQESMSEVQEEFRSAKPIGCVLRHFLPDRILFGIDTVIEDANALTSILLDDRKINGPRRTLNKDFLLDSKIINILTEILKPVIDIQELVRNRDIQPSIFGGEEIAVPLKVWQDIFRSLTREQRLEIQHTLRETENLFERICNSLRSSQKNNNTQAFIEARAPRHIMEAVWYLDSFFSSSLKYLGPLRDAPKPLYPLAPSADPYDVGLRGEHTAAVLDLHKNKQIKYIPSSHFTNPVIDTKVVARTLEAAVIDWLQYLGVAEKVKSTDRGKLGHELKVSLATTDQMHDLTHVGVGVSQVLPILVMCLLSEADTTLVFEQPELHLHPKVQTLLADFFISISLCKKQCIVETHSEYLIDRLRFRIAAAPEQADLTDISKIYFVEKENGNSNFRAVKINKYGAITDWPAGFFDQSQQQAEAILKAALNKKKNIKKRDSNNE